MTALVVIGAGGFGRETLDVIEAINAVDGRFDVVGVLDDGPSDRDRARVEARGVRFLGSTREWLAGDHPAAFVVAVGAPPARRHIAERWESAGRRTVTLVHPAAGLARHGSIGPGTIVCAGAQVSSNVRLGAYTHLNPNVTIGHDAVFEDYVSVNPGAVVSGDCVIAAETLLGSGSVVLQGLSVGAGSLVGAGACVVRDVAPGTTVTGVPARPVTP